VKWIIASSVVISVSEAIADLENVIVRHGHGALFKQAM
jgi:hypothetical protein